MKKWMKWFLPVMSVLVLVMSVVFRYGVGPAQAQETLNGSYEGVAEGFGGDVRAEVIFTEGVISEVNITAENETEDIGGQAAVQLAQAIVDNQSVNLDVVSGASVTSSAVLAAVTAAIESAGGNVADYQAEVAVGEDEERATQVVIVGAGGSGTAAALKAAEAGLDVIIIEKNGFVGGNTKISSGFFAVESSFQEEAGVETTVDEAVQQLLEFNNYLSNGPLTRAIVEQSADTVEWLDSLGMSITLQEETSQKAHEGDPYKAMSYHKYDDTDAGFEALYSHLNDLGAELILNTTFTDLIMEDGRVVGVICEKADGGQLTVMADAVVVTTGGFGGNQEMVEEATGLSIMTSLGVPNNGEGLTAMESIGAINQDAVPFLHGAQLAESEVTQDSDSETLAGYSNSPLTQLLMSPLLWVDSTGSRFVNEDVVYDTAFWANAAYAAGGRYYIVVDEATLNAYTNGTEMELSFAGPGPNLDEGDFVALAEQAVEGGTAYKADSLEELAEMAAMDPTDLVDSVASYNTMVENGVDTDYAKASESLLYGVAEGPFYAFDCRAVYLGSIGGVRVDEKLQVLDSQGQPIPGLFTGGSNAGGYYHGEGYPPYEGLASGFAWTSGRIAGDTIVELLVGEGE
ncbi:FAD-dependent oxidoreductase [Fundicoccus culcitae]|uniref:Urocanate reductase n=1 Tax=Fundicoccus culcitae TaxID=2969821 RepID=A0ABY5P3Q3_9LACT|nr:FAD-dependent oxidoreductase [Fundicoccus culcitae]UUX33362.1 FAD-dependent oxidoreductase [Fundicoccus culcitae]